MKRTLRSRLAAAWNNTREFLSPTDHKVATRRRARRPGSRRIGFESLEVRAALDSSGTLAAISGVVYNDLTGNGFSVDDTVRSGVTVQLYRDGGNGTFDNGAGDDTLTGSTTSAGNGAYNFANVASGTYFLREIAPGGTTQSFGGNPFRLRVVGDCVFVDNGTTIDSFEAPNVAVMQTQNQQNPDPTLIKTPAAGALGERDLLVTSQAAFGVFDSIMTGVGQGQLAVDTGGATARTRLQYDGNDADTVGPPAALINNNGLGGFNLVGANQNNGIALTFLLVEGPQATIQLQIRATSPGGGTASLTTTQASFNGGGGATTTKFVRFSDFQTSGNFSFSNLASFEIEFNTTNLANVDLRLANVTAERLAASLDFGNQSNLAQISGFVYVDANNNGVKDVGEAPITGVTIAIARTDNGGVFNSTTQTDGNGFWQFTGLNPGTYSVTETQPNNFVDGLDTIGSAGGTTGNDQFTNIVLTAGANSVNNNFGEQVRQSSIAGIVYVDANNNGVRDAGETGIPNVTITLAGNATGGSPVNATTTTNANGAYQFTNLNPGTYSVTETQPVNYNDGIDTIGSLGGTTTNDAHSNIQLPAATDAVNYNFGEVVQVFSKRRFTARSRRVVAVE